MRVRMTLCKMDSTRIFVRGLPPSLKDSELRDYFDGFDKRDPIATKLTDAHFIPHRRIGYVGYKTPEAATRAVKFFNKSFIRMSRIVAELARPIDLEKENTRKRSRNDTAFERSPKKRTAAGGGDKPTNASLTTFVDSIQSSSKRPTWSNEEDVLTRPSRPVVPVDPESDLEDYQDLGKPRKSPEGTRSDSQEPDAYGRGQPTPEAHEITNDSSRAELDIKGKSSTTDTDWLRSRTSRILDLMDSEDVDVHVSKAAESHDPRALDVSSDQPSIETHFAQIDKTLPAARTITDQSNILEAGTSTQDTGRLLIRNLLYDTTEEDLTAYLRKFGSIEEVHVCCDSKSGQSKGFAFVQFQNAEDAINTMEILDSKPFQGRNLHFEPAAQRRTDGVDEAALSKLSVKTQNQIRRKAAAPTESFRWNSLFMSADAIMSSVATRLGVAKSDVLDPTSADAAVRQAHAETKTIQDTQSYFKRNGVNIDSFDQGRRRGNSESVILVKNFPFGTSAPDIEAIFTKFGSVKRILIPPSATIAIVEMEHPPHAKAAFSAVSYSKFKDSILLLEKAPKNVFTQEAAAKSKHYMQPGSNTELGEDAAEGFENQDTAVSSSLFVDKIPWSVTSDTLRALFQPIDGFLSARVITRTDPKKSGQVLSRGFGFVEFRSKAQAKAAMFSLAGYKFPENQPLIMRPSQKASDLAEERRNEDKQKKLASQRTKVLIKNLPFEATKKDVRALFSPYGQLRSVRVPKKIDSSSRGFAFADFVTAKEAANAINALRNTHLLGRRLVLDYAVADSIDPEEEIRRMQQKVESQTEKMANSKLVSGSRKKFRAGGDEDQQ